MSTAYSDRWIEIHGGDMRDVLPTLAADSIHAVITSPPYWNLRDYGLPPSIWGGDPAHAHDWQAKSHRPQRHGDDGSGGNLEGSRRNQQQTRMGEIQTGQCDCGAWQGQLGLEPTPEMYVEHLVLALREVWRVLRPDGTLWLNLGDSYISTGGERTYGSYDGAVGRGPATSRMGLLASSTGLKPKDLAMVPARAAIALQADGWWLRKDIIWAKPNPMPESIEDRPTSSHEHVYLLAKSERYFYDGDAIRETAVYAAEAIYDPGTDGLGGDDRRTGKSTRRFGKREAADPLGLERRPSGWASPDGHNTMSGRYKRPAGWNNGATEDDRIGRYPVTEGGEVAALGRNKRDVWTIATAPYPGAHFATFPPRLVDPMVAAATSEHGVCPKCGTPWARIVRRRVAIEELDVAPAETIGWRPTCGDYPRTSEWREIPGQKATETDGHYRTRTAPLVALQADLMALWAPLNDAVAATVLDPFGGSGTVGLVAQQRRRRAVLIDLNPEYLKQAIERTSREFGVGGQRRRDEGRAPKAMDLGNGHRVEPLWSTEEVEEADEPEHGRDLRVGTGPVAEAG